MGLHLLLIGSGKMGGALLSGCLEGEALDHVVVVDPVAGDNVPGLGQDHRVQYCTDLSLIEPDLNFNVVIAAVKPQDMETALMATTDLLEPDTIFVSVAAGKPISFYEKYLRAGAPIVRAMPNTPARVGASATVCCGNDSVDEEARELIEILLGPVGFVHWVEDESLMDAVTALSGSGPAYVFLVIDILAAAARKIGLPEELCEDLAIETVFGAAKLASETTASPSELRKAVTSPNGTTQAALDVLMADTTLQDLFDRALQAARNRSKELSEG